MGLAEEQNYPTFLYSDKLTSKQNQKTKNNNVTGQATEDYICKKRPAVLIFFFFLFAKDKSSMVLKLFW